MRKKKINLTVADHVRVICNKWNRLKAFTVVQRLNPHENVQLVFVQQKITYCEEDNIP